jgi:hypothetical protein
MPQREMLPMSEVCLVRNKLVFVMGGGRFGKKALTYLKGKGAKVLLVDKNPECKASSEFDILAVDLNDLVSLRSGQAAFLVGDAVDLLASLLETNIPDLVVTAIPGNSVAKIVEVWLAKRGVTLQPYNKVIPNVLENIPKSLVSFVDETYGVIVVSYMPFNKRCRENCFPPKEICALTGSPKLTSMAKLLKFCVFKHTDFSGILCSKQLTGGLGAIDGKELHSILKQLETFHKPYTFSIGTACECHGILNLGKVNYLDSDYYS